MLLHWIRVWVVRSVVATPRLGPTECCHHNHQTQLGRIAAGDGATQNRLTFAMNALDSSSENLSSAVSRIRDAQLRAGEHADTG